MKKNLIALRKAVTNSLLQLSTGKTDDGMEVVYDGDSIVEGITLKTYNEKGELTPLPDGEYVIDGTEVVIADGVVNKIKTEADDENQGESKETNEEVELSAEDKEVGDIRTEFNALKEEFEALKAQIAESKQAIEDLRKILKMPADAPAPKAVELSSDNLNEGHKGYDRAFKLFSKINK